MYSAEEVRDVGVTRLQVKGVGHRHVAHVGHAALLMRIHSGDMMDTAHEAGHVADLARTMALSGSVFHAAIEWHTNECNIQSVRVAHQWGAHEGRNPGVTQCRHGVLSRLTCHAIHSLSGPM